MFATLLFTVLTLGSGVVARDTAKETSHEAPNEQVGTITGTVTVEQRPARRRARRYDGGRATPARTIQKLPMMVYLKGRVMGGAPPGDPLMAQKDTVFTPGILAVEVGTAVVFPNLDMFFHNVFSYSKTQRFDLGRYSKGESKSVMFPAPGIVKIYCEVHEFMRAVIIVTENRHHVVVDADGNFTLPEIPAGTYELVVWHPDLDDVTTEVTVLEGETARVEVTIQ